MKLVSVIIPTYNRAKFISRAIESCLRQTHSEIEILVVDDNSSDETTQVVASCKDPRIKYFLHKDNLGVAGARNTGLRNASGEFIAFLDDDDEWKPEKISRQLEVFKNNNSEIGLIFTNGCHEYAHNLFFKKEIPSRIVYNPKKDNYFPLQELISPTSSWMLPRIVVDKIGDFDNSMRSWEDGDYFVRVASKYPIYFLNENLVTWYALPVHLNKISYNLIQGKETFLKNNYGLIRKDKEYLFRFYRALGKDTVSIDKHIARKYLFKALKMRPFDFSTISKLIKCLGVG